MMNRDEDEWLWTGASPVKNSGVDRRTHGERGARAYNGEWGYSPSGVQGHIPWSGGQRAKPP